MCYTYQRGCLALLVQAVWAMREPQMAGRATCNDSRAFSLYNTIRTSLLGVWGLTYLMKLKLLPFKEMARFEMICSGLMLLTYFLPSVTVTSIDGYGTKNSFLYASALADDIGGIAFWLALLPVVNIIVKLFSRSRLMSFITLLSVPLPVYSAMHIVEMAADWGANYGIGLGCCLPVVLGVCILFSALISSPQKKEEMEVPEHEPVLEKKEAATQIDFKKRIQPAAQRIKDMIGKIIPLFKRNINERNIKVVGIVVAAMLAIFGIYKLVCSFSSVPFEVTVPQWEKFVTVNAKDVTVHQEPDMTSPKLVLKNVGAQDTDFYNMVFEWSAQHRSTRDVIVYTPVKEVEIFPVLEETEGWYKIYISSVDFGIYEYAYIPKDVCREVLPDDLSNGNMQLQGWFGRQISIAFPEGSKYRGCCILATSGDESNQCKIGIGRLVDNAIISPKFIDGMFVYPYYGKNDVQDFNGPVHQYGKYYKVEFVSAYLENTEYNFNVDAKKLSESQIDRLFSQFLANPANHMEVAYSFNGTLIHYIVDIDTYEYPLKKK